MSASMEKGRTVNSGTEATPGVALGLSLEASYEQPQDCIIFEVAIIWTC